MTGWRLVKASLAGQAFTGEGARLYGGRWSSPGVPVVYVSETLSLAALEVLVHLQSSGLLASYVAFRVDFDRRGSRSVDPAHLPEDWRSWPSPPELRAIGDEWARRGRSLILEVPSAVVPREHNYLINPAHPGFAGLAIGPPQPFTFDSRLS